MVTCAKIKSTATWRAEEVLAFVGEMRWNSQKIVASRLRDYWQH
jgi:hypothetical protein